MTEINLLELWDGFWDGDIWFASWSKAVGGLTAQEAAWKPDGGKRHSIWQNVNHVMFWRRRSIEMLQGIPAPGDSEVERLNFEEPADTSEAAWKQAKKRLHESHLRIREKITEGGKALDRVKYHLAHDAYHLGQIMVFRAMQGLQPIE